jgi:hypothetical protein
MYELINHGLLKPMRAEDEALSIMAVKTVIDWPVGGKKRQPEDEDDRAKG